jgi:hypothetical protein
VPVFEGAHVVGVEVHGFLVAAVPGVGLREKPRGLVFGVVEPEKKALAELAAGDA